MDLLLFHDVSRTRAPPKKLVAKLVAVTSPHLPRHPHDRKATVLEQVSWLAAQTRLSHLPGYRIGASGITEKALAAHSCGGSHGFETPCSLLVQPAKDRPEPEHAHYGAFPHQLSSEGGRKPEDEPSACPPSLDP